MSNLPIRQESAVTSVRSQLVDRRQQHRLGVINRQGELRVAQAIVEGIVAQTKASELGAVGTTAALAVATTHNWVVAASNGDPLLFDRLQGIVSAVTAASIGVIGNLAETYSRESRW